MEIWKDVKGYEGHYKVSDLGNVKSFKYGKEYILKKVKRGNYLKVNLSKNNKTTTKSVHTLVAEVFLNHTSSINMVVDHIDNNGNNNNLNNLQIITHRKNISKGRVNGSSKYTGVSWNKKSKVWMSSIAIDKIKIYLGGYDTEERASISYNFALTQLDKLKEYSLTK
jgi:hypothetical protein